MGTNYYLRRDVCSCCHHPKEEIHIGKSSAGWCFSLRVDPDLCIHNLDGWIRLFTEPNTEIRDEYGDHVSVGEMLATITQRMRSDQDWERWLIPRSQYSPYSSWAEFHERNHSEPGPNGMLRHRIDGVHCIAHGEGTWDLICGEFS